MLIIILPVFKRMILLLSLIAIGYLGGKTKVLTLEGNKSLSKLVNCITNPCSVLYSSLCTEHLLSNAEVVELLGVAVFMFLFLIFLAQFLPRLLHVPREHANSYRFMLIFSNLGYMGIPVVSSVFGSGATICVSIFIMVFYVFIYTYGIYLINDGKTRVHWKTFLTPMMISSLVSLCCYLLHIQVDGIPAEILSTLRNITTPCAMLIVGCALSSLPLKTMFSNWRLYIVAAIKLFVIPVCALMIIRLLHIQSLTLNVLIIVMAMPIASNFTMLSAQYDRDQTLAASSILITTLVSILTIPILAGLLMAG